VILDAGANVGAASLWFKAQFPEAWIVAVEPDPGNADVLRCNLNGRDRAVVLEAAIGATPGYVSLVPAVMSWAVRTERASMGCPVVTVDRAVGTVPCGELFIAKIDIEGFEHDLFSENLEWLDRAAVVIIEPHDWLLPGALTSRTFQAAFGSRCFEIFQLAENLVYVRCDDETLGKTLMPEPTLVEDA
jgi:FkbM family methyltransferase